MPETAPTNENNTLTYKGYPLTRCNNEIYYGKPEAPFVVFIQILSTEMKNDVEVAGRVHVSLISNDPNATGKARIIRQSDKMGLYSALDIGYIWLERANSDK